MSEKRIALIASVKGREEQLKIVLNRVLPQLDSVHLVLNFYTEVPDWLRKLKFKVITYLNPSNKNAHDAIWGVESIIGALLGQKAEDAYYLILDDDLFYPEDYVDKMVQAVERHGKKRVVCCHGANIVRPVEDYVKCRAVHGFSDSMKQDILVDMAGVGTVAYHSSTIRPTLQDFPIPFCRDLYFSILCAKRNVKIVNVQRPYEWIRPLKTMGDTVYDTTLNNAKFRRLKNRILKEQLLPLLFCDRSNDKYCFITDYSPFDQRLVDKMQESLRKHSDCNFMMFTDTEGPYYYPNRIIQYVDPEDRAIGICGSRVVTHYRMVNSLPKDSKVILADADLYFLGDPFVAFEQDFDIAVTTRCEPYQYPINSGVVMLRANKKVKSLLNFLASQVLERTWRPLIDFQNQFGRPGENEWYVDQDIVNALWIHKDEIRQQFDVKIIDIGPKFNFCPHADGAATESGKASLMKAYNEKTAVVLHLKSRLKELLFDGRFFHD